MIVGRKIPVFAEQKDRNSLPVFEQLEGGTKNDLRSAEKLMGKGAGCVKILIISPSNVWIEQRTMRPADAGSDVRSDLSPG